jgi:hypothetical protein
LGQRFVGADTAPHAARLLAGLLKPIEEEEQPNPGGPRRFASGQMGANLIEAIVRALHANGSQESRRIFEQILAGRVPTEDDQAAVDATLTVLVNNGGPACEEILFRALTEAEKLRPQTEGELTAEELRDKTLELVRQNASDGFRKKLAEYLTSPATSTGTSSSIGEFLQEDDPHNVGAQLVLYRHEATPRETKANFEQYFTNYSSEAMAGLLGIAAGTLRGSAGSYAPRRPPGGTEAPDEQADDDLPYRLATQLWSAQNAAAVEARLGGLESLEGEQNLLGLAATIPVDSMRSVLYKALATHWVDGPKLLEAAGVTKSLVSDPALLMSVKSLARKPPPGRAMGRTEREKFIEDKAEWEKFAEDFTRAWCERFRSATTAPAESAPATAEPPTEAKPLPAMPVELHSDSNVVAEYHAVWPEDIQQKASGVTLSPMQIHYVRIEEKARYRTMLGYYKRQLRAGVRDMHQTDKTDWLQSFRAVPQTDVHRAIDAMITRTETQPTGDQTSEVKETEDLVVEILSIEAKLPQAATR